MGVHHQHAVPLRGDHDQVMRMGGILAARAARTPWRALCAVGGLVRGFGEASGGVKGALLALRIEPLVITLT